MIDRHKLFDTTRANLFGVITQSQVDGINDIVTEWEAVNNQDYRQLAYGRDLVQTTWLRNYEKVKEFSGIDVVTYPDLIGKMPLAAKVAVYFMNKGYFTGKKLSHFFNDTTEDWYHARRIINGLDKADLVASYGKKFYDGLQ
jgi:putative chitinase